ncbi:VOC family protein [Massilia arenae]|uniref:VOC family protein n=1 Tax=Massilia arenae TaxID=2603288 RepID=A0A5C7G7G9_9BURK|nr:VOC family protein [Massilia arenae]TXG01988.1 VOC family protein [Massilia arenae]
MSVQVVTHLNFQGQARAALAFYQSVFGGELTQVTYAQLGRVANPADAERIVWGQVAAPNGFRIMAFDVASGTPWHQGENAFFVSLRGGSEQEIRELWDGLAQQASIVHPLAPAQWSPLYGMLKDRFGVTWVVDVAAGQAA